MARKKQGELLGVDPVGLDLATPSVQLDTGGVDDDVVDALGLQESMDPEAVAPRLVAGLHPSVLGEAEARLGGLDLSQKPVQVSSLGVTDFRLAYAVEGDAKLSGVLAQPKGNAGYGRCGSRMR